MKEYSKINVNEFGKATECPVCGNTHIVEGRYCQICGTDITNTCTNPDCGIILTGEARYCHKCGERSSFLQNNLLLPWDFDFDELPF